MPRNLKTNCRNAVDILDSDEELPDDYYEMVEVPAYLMKDRFDSVSFCWLDGMGVQQFDSASGNDKNNKLLNSLLKDLHTKTSPLVEGESVLIQQGYLSKWDILCLRSFEPKASDASLLWFLKYLTSKYMDSKYKFTSCLVAKEEFGSGSDNSDYKSFDSSSMYNKKNHKFTIIMKPF